MKRTPDIVYERELAPGQTIDRESRGGWQVGQMCQIWIHSLNAFCNGEIFAIDEGSDPIRYRIAVEEHSMLVWSQSLYPPMNANYSI